MVFLIAVEPITVRSLKPALTNIGAKPVHSCAWVLDYPGPAERLGRHLRAHLLPGYRCIISEVSGDYWAFL